MMSWMWLTLLYGVCKGFREIIKKGALVKNSVIEVLFFYTLIGFLFVLPDTKSAMQMDMQYLGYIFIKSAIIVVAWICSFTAIKFIPISMYGVLDLARVVFAMILGVVVLDERLSFNQVIGLVLVCTGLIMVNLKKEGANRKSNYKYIGLSLISCILNAVSGLMDKLLMRHIESGQMQFWYMLFMIILYFIVMVALKTKVDFKALVRNYWIPLMSIIFIIGDRALFVANAQADSRVTIMTLLKQVCVLITIIAGKVIFKEKGVAYRLVCAGIVVAGVVISAV